MAFAPALVIALIGAGIMGVGIAMLNTLMWALEADTVEYGEWKTGVRTEGTTYALFSFTRKLGQAFGGSAAAFTLGLGGYISANAGHQPESAQWAIRAACGLVPAGLFLLAISIRDNRFTFSMAIDGGMYSIRLRARKCEQGTQEMPLAFFEAEVERIRVHTTPSADVVSGITFTLRESSAVAVIDRWQRQIAALQAAS